jgi:hypothetical protein
VPYTTSGPAPAGNAGPGRVLDYHLRITVPYHLRRATTSEAVIRVFMVGSLGLLESSGAAGYHLTRAPRPSTKEAIMTRAMAMR